MPPEKKTEPPDSALEMTNIHHAAGLNDQLRKRIWESTRRAIEGQNLEILGELSSGATAVVLDAREKVGERLAGRRLIVKVIVEPENQHALACFRREVKILASEYVPTDVVPSLKYYQDVDDSKAPTIQPFLVMERIDGRPILDYVRNPRPLPIVDRIALIERGFLAYDRLHSCNILHGDPSPNNVLVEQGDKVRLIDLSQAKPLRSVGTRSDSAIGGTDGYRPESVLKGEERLAVWVDVHSFASVAFHMLTDRPPAKNPADAETLRAVGVPAEVIRVLIKALREKDQRKATDPKLYASAADVAKDLKAWREREERRAEQKRQLAWAFVIMLPVLALAWVGWTKHWADDRAERTREIVALRNQEAGLSQADHPKVKQLTARAATLIRDRDDALSRGETSQADALAPELIDLLRQDIKLREGLVRCLPLREALGQVLTRAPWVDEAPSIAAERKTLEAKYTEIGASLDEGKTESAWVELGRLNSALAELARRSVDAARVAEPRAVFNRVLAALSPKIRAQGSSDPVFTRLTKDAQEAESAWSVGDWSTAQRLFGLARKGLDDWLVGKETPEELAARRTTEGGSALAAAGRERALRGEVERLETLERQLAGQVQDLQGQITKLTVQNLSDRETAAVAVKDLASERSRREAAETKAEEAAKTLGLELATHKRTRELLEAERTGKQTALQEKTKAEADLAKSDAALQAALGDLNTWEAKYKAISATPPPRAQVAIPDRSVPGWVATKAGDLMIVKFKNQEIRFRWCPPGTFKMGDQQVETTLTSGYWMMETEVTQGLWKAAGGKTLRWDFGKGDNLPVYEVNQTEAVEFAAKLTDLLRRENLLPAGFKLALPIEAQWERAARAGTTTRFSFGDDESELGIYAWYEKNSSGKVHDVKTRRPNAWGIHDMAGNVWEWTLDRADGYPPTPLTGGLDPAGPSLGSSRVNRGGSWSYSAGTAPRRTAARSLRASRATTWAFASSQFR